MVKMFRMGPLFYLGIIVMVAVYLFDLVNLDDVDLGISPVHIVAYAALFVGLHWVMSKLTVYVDEWELFDRNIHFAEKVEMWREYGRPLVVPPEPHDHEKPHNTLFRNGKDMVFLSAYIYEHASLLEAAQESQDKELLKQLTPTADTTMGDMLKTLNNAGLKNLSGKDDDLKNACDIIRKDLNDCDHGERENMELTKETIIQCIRADHKDVKKSCVYAITRNDHFKRIMVVFRGTSNVGDWVKDLYAFQSKRKNPVNTLSRTPHIYLHSGFTKALIDNDDERDGKINEILEEVKEYMEHAKGYRYYYIRFCP